MASGESEETARVIVTPGIGADVVVVTARLAGGARPVEVRLDRAHVTDPELAALLRLMEQFIRRHDPERRHLRLLP